MSKVHRGKGIKSLVNRGRGECPICHTTGIKLLYENEIEGEKKSVCKVCNAKVKHSKS